MCKVQQAVINVKRSDGRPFVSDWGRTADEIDMHVTIGPPFWIHATPDMIDLEVGNFGWNIKPIHKINWFMYKDERLLKRSINRMMVQRGYKITGWVSISL